MNRSRENYGDGGRTIASKEETLRTGVTFGKELREPRGTEAGECSRCGRSLAVLLLLSGLAVRGAGAEPANLDVGKAPILLNRVAEMTEAVDPGLEIVDIVKTPELFSPVAGRTVWAGKKRPASWLRFVLVPARESDAEAQWLIILKPSFSVILDRAELYLPRDGGWTRYEAGATRALREGEYPARVFVFELPPAVLGTGYCYLRLQSSIDVGVEVFATTAFEFSRTEAMDHGAYGIMYGILLAMALYNFFLFVSLRDKTYLFYVLYVLSGALWLFWVQGHAMAILGRPRGSAVWPVWLFVGPMCSWGALFAASFLDLRHRSPFLNRVFMAMAIFGALVAITGIAGCTSVVFLLSHFLGLALPVLILVAAFLRFRQGFSGAWYFILAWTFLVVGALSFSLMGLKLLPVCFFTVNATALGMATESVLLSLALADRIKRLEAERRLLEHRGRQYLELSLTDPLTGLGNKRRLQGALPLEVDRARLLGRRLSLILFDLDDFKRVNDDYGHAVGDEVLKSLAALIPSCVREGDLGCRFGGEEFVILMPGAGAEEAYTAAERLRLRFSDLAHGSITGEVFHITLSLGVAELRPEEAPDSLMNRADTAMYRAKKKGKNRSEFD